MDNKIVNIGVLGCANIAIRSIIPAIQAQNHLFYLEGIASRDRQKADDVASMFKTKAYYSYQDLLEAEGLEAVYIPLPNALHAIWIEKALDKGLHVLVEKSLACTYEDVVRLNQIAKDKKRVLVENFQFRFHQQLSKIHEIINSNIIGDLRCIRSSFGFPPFPDPNNIRYRKELGGGALLDAGAYPIKLSQILLGENLAIKAATLAFDENKGVDIWGGGYIQQTDGKLFSEIAFGFDHYYQCSVELWGQRGRIFTNRIFTAPPGFEPDMIIETGKGKEIIKLPVDNHFNNMLEYFHKVIHDSNLAVEEYRRNINQAKLINDFKLKADEQ